MSQVLKNKIAAVQQKHRLVSMIEGIAATVATVVLLFGAGMLLDWFVEMDRIYRATILVVDLGVVGFILYRYVISPVLFGPDEEDVSLMVERAIPDFRTRLIASIQLARPHAVPAGASNVIARAMIAQTEEMAKPINFTGVIGHERMLRVGAIAAFIILLGMSGMVYGRPTSFVLLQRVFLSDEEIPRSTRILCLTGNRKVAIGDPIRLVIRAEGVIPQRGTVEIVYKGGRQVLALERDEGLEDRFAATMQNVDKSFEYRIRLNDARSKWFKIEAVPRPSITELVFDEERPKYANPEGKKLRCPTDKLRLLVGGKLHISLTANKPLQMAMVQIEGASQVPWSFLRTDALVPWRFLRISKGNLATGTIDVRRFGLSGVSFHLVDHDGIISSIDTVSQIERAFDLPPTVDLRSLPEKVTQRAAIPVIFEATDDYGLAKLVLHWKQVRNRDDVEGPPMPGERADTVVIPLDASSPGRADRPFDFDLQKHMTTPPELGKTIAYWLEAQDGNDLSGPGRAFSKRVYVSIVSEQDKLKELTERAGEQQKPVHDVKTDQEKLSKTLEERIKNALSPFR